VETKNQRRRLKGLQMHDEVCRHDGHRPGTITQKLDGYSKNKGKNHNAGETQAKVRRKYKEENKQSNRGTEGEGSGIGLSRRGSARP